MKMFSFWAMALCLITVISSSCKKNNGVTDDGIPTIGSMKATVDGSAWTADGAVAGLKDNVLVIGGSKNDQSGFTISIENPNANQEYPLTGVNKTSGSYSTKGSQNGYSTVIGGSGTAKLSTFSSNRAKGTFSFTAQDAFGNSISISNGSFEVQIAE